MTDFLSQKNRWSNYEDAIVSFFVSIPILSTFTEVTLFEISRDIINTCSRHRFLTTVPIYSQDDIDSELNAFTHFFYNHSALNSVFPSFLHPSRFPLKNKFEGENPLLSLMTYYNKYNILTNEDVFYLQMRLRKHTLDPHALTYTKIDDSEKIISNYYAYIPVLCRSINTSFRTQDFDKNTSYEFAIQLFSDIWFTNNSLNTSKTIHSIHRDSNLLAYTNTPRLNSFLRDLKKTILEYGGTWEIEDEGQLCNYVNEQSLQSYKEKYGDCSIPLNGKVLFSEEHY